VIARWSPGFAVAATAAVLILASACGGKSDPPTGGGTSGPAVAIQSSPPEHSAAPRTKEQLTSALLTVADLPAGFRVSPPGRQTNSEDTTGDPGCRKVSATYDALDAGTQPDQVAHAAMVFSKSEDLRGGDESLSSFKTEAAAKKEFSELVAAADVCHSFGVETGATTTILTGKPLRVPVVGDESRAYRYAGADQGRRFWEDLMVFRVDGTLALLTLASFGDAPESGLFEQVANKAAGKLA